MTDSTARALTTSGIPTWTFGDKLRKARDIAGLDQKTFAAQIGITSSSLAAYETGRTSPRFDKAPSIAKSVQMLVGIPYQWFLVDDDSPRGTSPMGSQALTTDYGYAVSPIVNLADHRQARTAS